MFNSTKLLYHCGKSFLVILLFGYTANAQELYPVLLSNAPWHGEQRTLRYHPEGEDFVITNGNRRFNRALYGTHTAFRVEAGDLPEFSLYMPGLGGTLKLGLAKGAKSLWLTEARKIKAIYTPGRMSYEIEDPVLGAGKLYLTVLAMAGTEGMVLKTRFEGTEKGINLIYAFGGASGKKFPRAGDMGPDPESSFYLTAENCVTNQYRINNDTFELKYGGAGSASLSGVFPTALKLADAGHLNSPAELYGSTGASSPVLTGSKALINGESIYAVIKNPVAEKPDPIGNISYKTASSIFTAAEYARKKIAERIRVNTPDPYINTIGGAISIASDGIWEAPSYMHGAVGWRMRLNGWRGPYTADPLGWHDRGRTHFEAYSRSQVTEPLAGPVIADTAFHLARHQEKMGTSMFSAGYISRDPDGKSIRPHHYDMNLVYIDGLLWHFNWTGDRAFAKKMWPVIQRHLAWEKRNFDPDNNGLYDAYAVIWASDALYYSGGEVTHSSAYNYRANKKAAEIAALIGEDPKPYAIEADLILKAMNSSLWMPGKGVYAEYKDILGLKNVHPSAALWTVYHSIDSEVPDAFQAWQSLRYIDQEIPHIPVKAAGLADGQYYTLSTSSWMPYTWSINNVVMAESMHTALANWEAGRNEEGFKLFKSELLAAMYLGGSPGNFVQISHYDAARGEAYRDFGDPVGISSRALVEGLFGIVPDALHNRLTIRPGFPQNWDHASLATPDLDFKFKRTGQTDHYNFKLSFDVPLALKLQLKAGGSTVSSVLVNGKKVNWKNIKDAVGLPVIEISALAGKTEARQGKVSTKQDEGGSEQYDIQVVWQGQPFKKPVIAASYATGDQLSVDFDGATIVKVNDPQQGFKTISFKQGKLSGVLSDHTGNRTVFVQLKRGSYMWWYPVCFELKALVSAISQVKENGNGLAFRLVNNSNTQIKGVLSLKNGERDLDKPITLQAGAGSFILSFPNELIATGTNNFNFTAEDGRVTTFDLISWDIKKKELSQRTVDLSGYFNDQVTQIFKHKYLSPRPLSGPTLQLPWQGIGDWPHALEMADIDDAGLRKMAGTANEFTLPQGLKFKTPGAPGVKNILFTSQWDNYPSEKEVPLEGKASHAYFLMAGSTNHMQSQLDNGKIVISYTDGSSAELVLRNPETWWPIQEDYYTDGFAFNLQKPRPVRIHLKTGMIVPGGAGSADPQTGATDADHQLIHGGAATVLDLLLDPEKNLKSLKLVTLANDVVIGLMSVTLIMN